MANDQKQDDKKLLDKINKEDIKNNECPQKDADGNCLVPGVYSDSDLIGGG